MSDCPNGEIRDLLPDLVHGTLRGEARTRVEAHVAGCAECAAEVALLREARRVLQRAPALDVARVAEGVRRRVALRARPTRTFSTPRVAAWRIAAGVVAVAAGASWLATRSDGGGRPQSGGPTPQASAGPAEVAGLSVGGALSDLSDSDLRALIDDVGALDAAPAPEPEPALPVDFER